MEEDVKSEQQPKESSEWNAMIFPVTFSVLGAVLREFVSKDLSFILAGLVSACISYPFLPEPKVKFLKYFGTLSAIFVMYAITIYSISPYFEKIIPPFWAYFLPLFALFCSIYFLSPLSGSNKSEFWKWSLASLAFAGFFSLIQVQS